jgi:hypothetical protein
MRANRSDRLPWDIEQAMSALQIDKSWYEEYWLKPAKPRPPGVIARLLRNAKCSVSYTGRVLKHALAAIDVGGRIQLARSARNSMHSEIASTNVRIISSASSKGHPTLK